MAAKKRTKDRGEVVRLSNVVSKKLKQHKKRKALPRKEGKKKKGASPFESYDSVLRRILGLPDREGNSQSLKEYWILTKPHLAIFDRKGDAQGEAIVRAVANGWRRNESPKKVKEVAK